MTRRRRWAAADSWVSQRARLELSAVGVTGGTHMTRKVTYRWPKRNRNGARPGTYKPISVPRAKAPKMV